MTSEADKPDFVPSWMRWPPNCCETCVNWSQIDAYTGKCSKSIFDEITDSRFRCADFTRKDNT